MLKKLGAWFFVATCLLPGASAGSPGASVRGVSRPAHRKVPQTQSNAGTLPGQSRTLMPDGRVLLFGGEGANGPVNTVALQDPANGLIVTLPVTLLRARAWHSASLLPNGTVLILGGLGTDGSVVKDAELFDPATLTLQRLSLNGVTPRSSHTATLLTDGRVLIAGGVDADGKTVGELEVWDLGTVQGTKVAELLTPRSKQSATVLPDGTVLFWGGVSRNGLALNYGEIFDPNTDSLRIQSSPIQPANDPRGPQLEESRPQDGTTDAPVNTMIAVRFSKPLNVNTVTASSVTLSSPQASVDVRVIPAEGGMLAFVTPKAALNQETSYTLSLVGLTDNSGQLLPDKNILFTTTGTQTNSGSGSGTATGVSGGGTNAGNSSDPQHSPWRNLSPLQAKPGVTALAGQVLTLDGQPLAKVSLEIDKQFVQTDETGRFLLQPLTAGHHTMWIDGQTASTKKETYGLFEVGIDITVGQTNVLNYTIWMPLLDMANAVTIPSPTQNEVVVTTPTLPGLELRLPPQATILDRNGNVVTKVSITPIPVKQPPFPLPKGVLVPLYFTIQPGGAYIQVANADGPQGARLYYPNTYHYPSGSVYNFYNYDADNKGWYVYGQGKVSADRSQVIPNPGVSIYEFTGAMVSQPGNHPAVPLVPGDPRRGDPVDLQTGLFVYNKTDLVLSDVIPLVLTRTYRPNDYISRAFGIGTNHTFDIFMVGDNNAFPEGYTYQDLILPDGGRIHFTRTSPCTGANGYCDFVDAVYTATSTTTDFYGATLKYQSCGFNAAVWCLTKKDGTTYGFPDSDQSTVSQAAAPVGMRDRYGNAVTFVRDSNSNLTQITSPNGRFINFTLDLNNRITQAQDNLGRTVLYTYDTPCGTGLLCTVTDANGGVWTYTYDLNNNMLTIKDPRQIVYLTNYYDANNRVYKQVQADNGTYLFSYTLDQNGNVTQTNVTDPRLFVEQAVFNSDGYMTSDTFAVGKPEQETITYNRQLASGLVQSVTDALGRITSYSYDAMGNVTSVTRLAGTQNAVTTRFAYESTFNQLTAVTDPLGHTTSFSYDANGNLIAIVNPLGNSASMAYNSAGQPVSVTDPVGNTSQFGYDSGDLVGITDPLGRTLYRFVDAAGRLVSVTDPLGRITKYAYNPLNQVLSVTDALGKQTLFSYDPNGNLLSVTDANNHVTQYTYDNMDRVQTRKDALLNQECYGTFSGGVCQANGYDGNGNLVQFTDRRGKVAVFNYDGLNRITFAGYGMTPGPVYESTVNYTTYDAGNRLKQVVDSISGTINRGFDDLDRLTSDATPQGTVSYTYDNAGRRASLTVPGQSVVNYTFDNANRLTQITQGTTTVLFGYDNANRRKTLTLPNGVVTGYSYDGASQLAGLTYSLGQTALGNLTYAYDNTGRRNNVGGTYARTGLPLAMSQTGYNANNQLTTWGTASLFYDLNGNMTSDGTHSYTWDARNRLKQIDLGNTASFTYDPFGRRATKSNVGTSTTFLYDGANAVQEVIGGTNTANSLGGGIDEVFQRTDSAGARSFLTDALGTTLALTDSTGTVQTSYSFEPFGNTTASGSATTNSFAYTGRELDAGNLYYYRARYYNPTLQRFISEDPIEFEGSGPNSYAYVFNGPTNLIDPFGLRPGDKYSRIDCAGWNSVSDILPLTRFNKIEFGGFIYQNPDGTYSYTVPTTGQRTTIPDFQARTPIPSGTSKAGWYHTHPPALGPDYDPSIFSIGDKNVSEHLNGADEVPGTTGPGYLGTPDNVIKVYVPDPFHPLDGKTITLAKKPCGCK
jgi:RHS repeat-associated protein